jgi:serine/threonine protein kinase
MGDILSALSYVESHKAVHRDLKPENLIFRYDSPTSDLILVDFGLGAYNRENSFKRCGTPGFVAPEIILTPSNEISKKTPKCDVFSAGLIFYSMYSRFPPPFQYIFLNPVFWLDFIAYCLIELFFRSRLTGKQAITGKTFKDVIQSNRKLLINYDLEEFKKAPEDALDLMRKMLAIDPEKRPTAAEALEHSFFSGKKLETTVDERSECKCGSNNPLPCHKSKIEIDKERK